MEYTFRIRRLDPERDAGPRWEEFTVDVEPTERVLDALIRIKDTLDGSLTFRRSCAHGICGSCAVNMNGENALACQTLVRDLPRNSTIGPLPALPVVKDLVVDVEPFFLKNDEVMPFLINDEPAPERERLQSPEEHEHIAEAITCIMCASCTSACPVFRADMEYLGPSAILKAYRFIYDTRDRAKDRRLARITEPEGVWRCHSVYNCVEVCPKGIDVTSHISRLKRLALKRKLFRR
jgi:succinate dehydrogenase / fumarate reductase iron-sulfur subunit